MLMLKLRSLITALALAAALSPAAYAASASKAFTVTNTGNGPLTISGAVITGNTAEYALTGNTCTSVVVGGSCALTVTFTPSGTGARTAASLNFSSNGSNGPIHSIALAGTGAPNEVTRTISANIANVNMAALFGNPTTVASYVLTVNSGVYVYSSSTATAALVTGIFPAGSAVKIVNNGYIVGKGGPGGTGANNGGNGSPGGAGGPAISLSTPVTLTNNGLIGGGGGGGGGSGAYINDNGSTVGGGGGGGQGNGAAGSKGTVATYTHTGTSGTAGSLTANGVGVATSPWSHRGGDGGTYGVAGSTGGDGAFDYSPSSVGSGLDGGAAGKAVLTNGNAITWISGNNPTQVKGAVQ